MEETAETMPVPSPARPWAQILRHGVIVLLSALVFASVILYFREFVLAVRFPAIGWLALLFVLFTFIRSFFLLVSWTCRWYRTQIGAAKLLFVFVLMVLIIISLVIFDVTATALEPVYADRLVFLEPAALPSYLGLQRNAIDQSRVAQAIHALVNEERAQYGLSALTYDFALEEIAQSHSGDMAARLYLEHTSQEGTTAIQRGNKAGYLCEKRYATNISRGIGENLARIPLGNVQGCGSVYTAQEIARCTVRGWMQSEEHRKNILTATYDKEGVGVARNKNDFYITQNFC